LAQGFKLQYCIFFFYAAYGLRTAMLVPVPGFHRSYDLKVIDFDAKALARQQRLLELEGRISEVCSNISSCGSEVSVPSRPPPRPPTPPVLKRPAGRRPLPPVEQKQIPEWAQDFENLCDLIGNKAAARYRTVGQAMLHINRNRNGMMERDEIHTIFREFNLPQEYADCFFNHLCPFSESMEVAVLWQVLGPYIVPGYPSERRPPSRCKTPDQAASIASPSSARPQGRSSRPDSAGIRREAAPSAPSQTPLPQAHASFRPSSARAKVAVAGGSAGLRAARAVAAQAEARGPTLIDTEITERFRTMQQAFLKIDANRDGHISKQELLEKCREWNIPEAEAALVLAQADINGDHELDFNEFTENFNPQNGLYPVHALKPTGCGSGAASIASVSTRASYASVGRARPLSARGVGAGGVRPGSGGTSASAERRLSEGLSPERGSRRRARSWAPSSRRAARSVQEEPMLSTTGNVDEDTMLWRRYLAQQKNKRSIGVATTPRLLEREAWRNGCTHEHDQFTAVHGASHTSCRHCHAPLSSSRPHEVYLTNSNRLASSMRRSRSAPGGAPRWLPLQRGRSVKSTPIHGHPTGRQDTPRSMAARGPNTSITDHRGSYALDLHACGEGESVSSSLMASR